MTDGGNTFPEWGNWREYQEAVATCFRRLGYAVEVDATVEGVRGTHSVDVRVAFSQHGLACQWIVECKLWKRRVTKEKVLALQAIVADVGADRGVLFSEGGFQTGAQRVAQGSNVTLVPSRKEFIATASATDPPKEDRLLEIPQIDGGPTVFRFPGPPARPQHLVRNGNSLIVGNWNTGNITFVDPQSRSIEAVIDLDRYETTRNRERVREIRTHPPGQLAVADGKLFLGQVFSESILVIDLATKSVVRRVLVPGGGHGAITASADGRTIYFASNKDHALFLLDSATYELHRYPYPPGGRGAMSIACSSDGSRVFVGIQRGYRSASVDVPGEGCFLATFLLDRRSFVHSLPLSEFAQGRPDSSTPAYILPEPTSSRLYVGMFQGRPGIYLLDGDPLRILRCSATQPNARNPYFQWVDPLAIQFFGEDLVAIHRNNRDLVLLDRETLAVKRTSYLGEAPNGPRDLVVLGSPSSRHIPGQGWAAVPGLGYN